MPGLEQDATVPPTPACSSAGQAAGLDDCLAKLMGSLAKAGAEHPDLLSSALHGGPVRADLHGVLAQLAPGQMLPILDWLSRASLPNRRELLQALLDDGPPGSAPVLRAVLQAAHREDLLAAIFHPDRVHRLRQACRTLTKEPT